MPGSEEDLTRLLRALLMRGFASGEKLTFEGEVAPV